MCRAHGWQSAAIIRYGGGRREAKGAAYGAERGGHRVDQSLVSGQALSADLLSKVSLQRRVDHLPGRRVGRGPGRWRELVHSFQGKQGCLAGGAYEGGICLEKGSTYDPEATAKAGKALGLCR